MTPEQLAATKKQQRLQQIVDNAKNGIVSGNQNNPKQRLSQKQQDLIDKTNLNRPKSTEPVAKPTGAKSSDYPGFIPGTLMALGQGVTFGYGDELSGAANKLFGGDYDTAVQSARDKNQAFAEENPVTDFATQLVGGASTGILGAGKVAATKAGSAIANALRNVPNYIKYTGAGAGGAGIAGGGYATDDKIGEAIEAAKYGAGFGIAGPPIARFGGKMYDSFIDPVVEQLKSPMSQALRKISAYLDKDSLTPEEFGANALRLGDQSMFADSGGENILSLADQLVTKPGTSRNIALKKLKERQTDQGKRVGDDLIDSFDNDVNYYETLDKINVNLKTKAKPFYDKAYKADVFMTEELTELSKLPYVRRAMKLGVEKAKNEKSLNLQEIFVMNKGKIVGMKKDPDLQTWDYIKRGLDDMIDRETDNITGKMTDKGRIITVLKKRLTTELDEIVPDYKTARKIYGNEAQNLKALENGRKFEKQDFEITTKILNEMSNSEKENFRAGAMRAIQDKINNAPDGADVYKRIFNSKNKRKKLKAIFPDDETFEKFANKMEAESVFSKTNAKLTGGSPTAERLNYGNDGNLTERTVRDASQGNVVGLAEGLVSKIAKDAQKIGEPTRQYMGDILFEQDNAKQKMYIDLLRNIRQPGTPRFNSPQRLGAVTGVGSQFGDITTR